ncbi:hypothetical protein ZWY2020_027063 [Hordeum vulgare]|nr:hypothetical protein ZWY2020_027063 [Hordeum vulgare]
MAAAALRQPPPRPVVAQRQLAACPTGPFSQARPAHTPPLGTVPAGSLLCRGRQEVLKTHDCAFSSRHLTPTLHIFSCGVRHPLLPYGDLWCQLRRICLLELMAHAVSCPSATSGKMRSPT